MNVLVMVSDKETANIISFCLEGQFNAKVLTADTSQSAIDLLLEEAEIDFIVCDQNAGSNKLSKFLVSTHAPIPVILIKKPGEVGLDAYPELKVIAEMGYSELRTGLAHQVKKFLSNSESDNSNRERMVRIKTELLLGVGPLKGDVYVRLSSVKHVKLFRRGHVFKPEDLKRYLKDRGIEYLFVKKSDAQEFAEKLVSLIEEKIETSPRDLGENLEVLSHLFEQIQALASTLGFSPEVNQIARETVNLTMKAVGSDPKLSDFIKNFEQHKSSYISSHSLMIANVSVSIAAMMKWPSAATFQKLIYAALFHDLSIQNDALAQIQTLSELDLERARFTSEEILDYPSHPYKSAELLSQFKELPPDIDSIILQHHERPDGSGFPAGLNAMAISPISAAFIISHDLVNHFMAKGSAAGISKYLQKNYEYYARGSFKDIMKTLREHQSLIPEDTFKRPIAS